MKLSFFPLFILFLLVGCQEDNRYVQELENPEHFRKSMKQLSDVIVHDIFSPPVASRIYVYASIAAHEAMSQSGSTSYQSLAGQLNGLSDLPSPGDEPINFQLAALHAFLNVGTQLIFSEEKMDTYRENLYASLKSQGLPKQVMRSSLAYGDQISSHILAWADTDMYKETRTFPKYTVLKEDKYWKPTPPDYMEGIEPSWNKIRTLALDSSGQFPPAPPLAVTLDPKSEFYRQLMEVYEVGKKLDEESVEIAKFWDCNPYVSHHKGHAMFATKKITPGGHWIGIAEIASREAGSDFAETVAAYTYTSIALFDGFISCWDEKWRSIVVRPETLINQYIDQQWTPLLQTPPFPEYTSGHSVISRAAATVLTDFYGEDFSFLDTTEEEFGIPARQFASFLQASEEAAISRLYGGIHYMMAIEQGVIQGDRVGKHIVNKLSLKPNDEIASFKNH